MPKQLAKPTSPRNTANTTTTPINHRAKFRFATGKTKHPHRNRGAI